MIERRTILTVAGLAAAVTALAVTFGSAPHATASRPRIPSDSNEVLESRPFGSGDARGREIASLRRGLARTPTDLSRAVRLARLDVMLARERSDPRYLGRAQAALAPWWSEVDAPVDVLVLRATIRQSLHEFEAALVDLDHAVAVAPDHAQAWLTRAVVLSVRGRYVEARESCRHLVPLASKLVVTVCETGIDSVTGGAAAAEGRLRDVLTAGGATSADEEAWARSSLAEYAIRAGRLDEATEQFTRAIALDPNDAYSRAACADLYLDRERPKEALALVAGREVNDTLLLRIALAEKRAGAREAESHIEALAARFDASRLRGDVVHRREEARFWLLLKGDAARALTLAKANWDVQKEPADARIFVEAAVAAKDPRAGASVLAWLDETKLEDPVIAKLAGELRAMARP